MKKITNLLLLMMFMSSMVLVGQTSINSTISNEEAQMMEQRRPVSPNAQTQALPAQMLNAKGTTFTVPASGSRAISNVSIAVTVDYWIGEASYNLWSYTSNSYYWATNQVFSATYETITHVLPLTEGDLYAVVCWDSYGDGGIGGVVSNDDTGWFIMNWSNNDYTNTGIFDFTAWDGFPPPVYVPITTFPFLADFEDGVLSGDEYLQPLTDTYSGAYLSASAADASLFGFMMEGGSSGSGWFNGTPYPNVFTTNSSHVSELLMEVHPDLADPGYLFMTFDMRQNYSFNSGYEFFRVLVDGVPVTDINGVEYWQPVTDGDDPWQNLTFDLTAFKTLASFEITLQNAGKYYYGYSTDGDVAMIDNMGIFYSVPGLEIVNDALDMGDRPIGAWMKSASYEFVNNPGVGDISITNADIDENYTGFLAVEAPALPYTLASGATTFEFGIATTEEVVTDGAFAGNFAVFYGSTRAISHATYFGNAYTPDPGDVWELALDGNAAAYPVNVPVGTFRNNYEMPGADADGWDVVYTYTFATDVVFNAGLTATDAKMAIYSTDFEGVGGPDYENELFTGTTTLVDIELSAGTYYMAVSATGADYTLAVTFPNMPLPDAATYVAPFDGETGIINGNDLVWTFGANTVDYQVILGTTYPPTDVVVDWTDNLAELYELVSTQPNLQYFWQINTGNSTGTTDGPVWGFTTAITPPAGLVVTLNDAGETAPTVSTSLVWDAPATRAFLGYNVYRNGTQIATLVDVESYSDLALARDASYTYYVTSVFDQGESGPSNEETVFALGVGTLNGVVTDILAPNDPIEGATVNIFGDPYSYTGLTTNADGEYSTLAYSGIYEIGVSATAYNTETAGPIALAHGATVTTDFALTETPLPVGDVVAVEMDADKVHVSWGDAPPAPVMEWLGYGGETHDGNWWLGAGAAFTTAINFYPVDLIDLDGTSLTKFSIYNSNCDNSNVSTLKIYEGDVEGGTAVLLHEQGLVDLTLAEWNEIELTVPVPIDIAQQLWVVVERPAATCGTSSSSNDFNANGDWVYYNGAWIHMAIQWGLAYNWNMKVFATNATTTRGSIEIVRRAQEPLKDNTANAQLENLIEEGNVGNDITFRPEMNTRGIVSYDVYRNKVYQPDAAILVGTTIQQDFIDFDWGIQDWGVYRWSVVVNYDAGQVSVPTYSNPLETDMEILVSALVNTNSGDSPAGTSVTFTNTSEVDEFGDPIYIFHELLGNDGFASWADFRRGTYDIEVLLPGFTSIDIVDYNIFDNEDFEWMLEEIIGMPGSLYVTPTGYATWIGSSGSAPFDPFLETFDAVAVGDLPTGWSKLPETSNWGAYDNDYAGGAAPEMRFRWSPSSTDEFYLITPMMSTEGQTELAFSFKQNVNDFNGNYTLRVVAIADGVEYIIEEWLNPTSLPATDMSYTLTDAHGIGAAEFQLAWVMDGYSFNINYWYIDDVMLNGPSKGKSPSRAFELYKVFHDGALITEVLHTEYQYGTEGEVLVAGTEYTAGVAAVYTMGQSVTAEFDWVYVPCDDYDAPTAFTAAQVEGTLDILLEWTNVNAAALDTIAGVRVYRDGVAHAFVDFTGGIVNTYSDGPLEFGTYNYCITYIYDSGAETCQGVVCSGDVEIDGNATVDGFVFEEDYLGGDPIEDASVYLVNVDFPDIDFEFFADADGAYDGSVIAGTYDYTVSAEGYITEVLAGVVVPLNGNVSNTFELMEFPAPPVEVVATELNDDEVLLTWHNPTFTVFEPSTYDFEAGADGWDIQGNVDGWQWGNNASLSSSWMGFDGNETNFIAVNADAAGSGGSSINVMATSPVLEFANNEHVYVSFDYILVYDALSMYYSIDGDTPVLIENLSGSDSWTNHMVEVPAIALVNNIQIIFKFIENGTWGYGAGVDNIAITNELTRSGEPVLVTKPNSTRDMTGYEIYRTTCQTGDLQFVGFVPATDSMFTDHNWGTVEPNVYKWGVVAQYEQNVSEVAFSNCLDKDMFTNVSVTVTTNSGDSPFGTLVTFTNMSEPGQGWDKFVQLDETGYFEWDDFRLGTYDINVEKAGFTPIELLGESIWEPTDYVWNLEEALTPVGDLHVSPTAMATWTGTSGPPPPPPPPPLIVLIDETFEDYTAGGYLAEQAQAMGRDYWTTWSGTVGGSEDATISDAHAFAGNNSAKIAPDVDAVLLLDENYTSGVFNVDFEIFIPSGSTGYYNLLQNFAGSSSSWGTQTYFNPGGAGLIDAGGAGAGTFTYTYDTWHHVYTFVDLDNDYAEIYFNGDFVVSWQWSTGTGSSSLNEFHAMDFYGAAPTDAALYDNISITKEPEVSSPQASNNSRVLEYYKVWLDGNFVVNTEDDYHQYNVENLVKGQEYYSEVAAMYTNGMSEKMDYTWTYMPCDSFPGPANLAGEAIVNDVYLTWGGTPVPPPPPVIIIVDETFEDYSAGGHVAEQAQAMGRDYWTTWSGTVGGSEDPMVSDVQASAGSNSIVVEGTNDGVILLDNYTSGVFNVDFDVYIPTGKTGYFNLLQLFAGANSSWGTQTFFNPGGAASVDAGGEGSATFTFTYDTWHHVYTLVDLDADYAEMYFNGDFVVSWTWSGGAFGTNTLNEFNAMNLYAWADTGTPGTFFDNISITKESDVRASMTTLSENTGVNAEADLNAEPRSVEFNRALWDIQYSIDMGGPSGLVGLAGAECDGEFIYATKWNSSDIVKFTVDGSYIETFSIPGVSGLRDLAFDGTYMYGSNASTTVYKMDFSNHSLVSTFTAPTQVRAIAYDDDDNAFWANNWSTDLIKFDENGTTLASIAAPPSMYGMAYDNDISGGPYLWIFTGTTSNGGCQIEQINIGTGNITGEGHSVSDDFGGGYIAGGLYIIEDLVSGTRTIGGTAQGTPDLAYGYEIGTTGGGGGGYDPGPVIGANIYRDGVLIAEMVTDTFYVDMGLNYGLYEYCVILLYEDMAASCEGSCVDVEVDEDCIAPVDLTIELEGANLVHLNWDPSNNIAEWLYYDDGTNETSIGGPAEFIWAIKFDPDQLADLDGASVTKISVFGQTADVNTLQIFEGANASTLLFEQDLIGLTVGAWNDVDLTSPVTIDVSKELWIGIYTTAGGAYPSACGAGMNEPNGDLISMDGSTWEHLTDYGLNYTWNLRAFATNETLKEVQLGSIVNNNVYNSVGTFATSGIINTSENAVLVMEPKATRSFIGYNIYHQGELMEALWPDNFYDYEEMQTNTHCYTVTSEYSFCGESDHSNEVCEDIIGINEIDENDISLYPNPASNRVNVTSIHKMTRLTVVNYVGQIVYVEDVNDATRVELNTNSYQAGVYLVKIETESGVVTKRVIIRR